jgi:hypothetical protein
MGRAHGDVARAGGGGYIDDNICTARDPLAGLLTPFIFKNIPELDS